MKKIYFLAIAAIFTVTCFAQKASQQVPYSFSFEKAIQSNDKALGDTIYSHLSGTPTLYSSSGGGYVAGQNAYGDIAKLQRFDAAHGLTSNTGTITDLLFWFGHAEASGPNAVFNATIWADNAGTPGAILGTVSVPYSAIDTVVANIMTNGTVGWNAVATFSPAIAIPTSQAFWAGFEFTYAAGDTLGLVTNTDGDFIDAVTNTWEQWSSLAFNSFNDGSGNDWGLDIALAVFPVMNYSTGIEESASVAYSVYPNPSAGEFTINLNSENSNTISLSVKNVVGQTVINKTIAVNGKTKETISLANYSKGIYFLTVNNKTTKLIVE